VRLSGEGGRRQTCRRFFKDVEKFELGTMQCKGATGINRCEEQQIRATYRARRRRSKISRSSTIKAWILRGAMLDRL
jgi:hypothetical protein